MLDKDWEDLLATATGEVLETMFFAGVYGPATPGSAATGSCISANLSFQGTPSGVLTVTVAEPAIRALAANFLASEEDEPLPTAQLECVVCELVNMICGSLLSHVKTEDHFRLSSPQLLPEIVIRPDGLPTQSLDLGEGAIEMWLLLEPNAN